MAFLKFLRGIYWIFFDKLVTPVLNYGSEVWGFCKANQVERVQSQFCKHLFGIKQSPQNNFIYGELGRIPYQIRRHFLILKYWLKVVVKRENKFVSLIYKMMLKDIDNDNRKVNWASLVKTLLCNLGF